MRNATASQAAGPRGESLWVVPRGALRWDGKTFPSRNANVKRITLCREEFGPVWERPSPNQHSLMPDRQAICARNRHGIGPVAYSSAQRAIHSSSQGHRPWETLPARWASLHCGTRVQGRWPWLDELLAPWAAITETFCLLRMGIPHCVDCRDSTLESRTLRRLPTLLRFHQPAPLATYPAILDLRRRLP